MPDLKEDSPRRILVIDADTKVHTEFCGIFDSHSLAVTFDEKNSECSLHGNEADESSSSIRGLSYSISSAHDANEGIAKATKALQCNAPYVAVFIDVEQASIRGGLQVVKQFWEIDPRLEVVICTQSCSKSWEKIATEIGPHSQLLILKKPFDKAELAQVVVSLSEKWYVARRLESEIDRMERSIAERTEQIERAHRETDSLLASISSLLIGVDENGLVRRWNKSAEELFGVESSEAVGKSLRALDIEWADPEAADRFFNAHQATAVTRRALKLVRDGSIRVMGASTYPVIDNGRQRGFICLGTDITKQCQMEQQLQQARKLEAVGQLAAGVAHEINTPMQYLGDNLDFLRNKLQKLEPVMEGLQQILKASESGDDIQQELEVLKAGLGKLKLKSFAGQVSEAIDDSRDGVRHVSRIVRAMKEFAHPGQEEKTPVDINRAIESTIAVSTNEWKYVAEIKKVLGKSLPPVLALAGELNQVFLNLLVNAAHAIGDTNQGGATGKGVITLTTRATEEYVEISIADTGTGIPDELKQRIFDPFFTTKEVGVGTGQGLAIAHAVVVQKHNGTLWCDSAVGAGTTFFIQLPLEPSEKVTAGDREPAMVCE